VIVLNGYLVLNVCICGYLLYSRYQGKKPSKWFYIPFVFIRDCLGRVHSHRHRVP
jgi:molybdopterin-containing oxidoreductase family membrane subunit